MRGQACEEKARLPAPVPTRTPALSARGESRFASPAESPDPAGYARRRSYHEQYESRLSVQVPMTGERHGGVVRIHWTVI